MILISSFNMNRNLLTDFGLVDRHIEMGKWPIGEATFQASAVFV